jgi:hypothetical protein
MGTIFQDSTNNYHRNTENTMEYMATEEQSLRSLVALFLSDLAHANH